ncbi:MAG TPA: ubiquinone biosynthesis protein UbiB [Betaproteobacteria bacterium]|nr:ubiquinone biosynthesis protein UbiB [Betaproteobacteria bacterium]
MLWETFNVVRDIPRLHEITTVLIRYGLGDMVRRMGLAGVLERAGRILHWKASSEILHLEPAVRARRALEDLGPAFVKLGQVLATRVDLFSPPWIAEFEKLQSDVPPVPFETLIPVLETALGRSPFAVFQDLRTDAAAAASIAQVHRAALADGAPVILKIRRPGIRAKIEADLRILAHLAALLESEVPESRRYRPSQVAAQFARSLRRELDLAREARNIERFARNFAGDETIVIPQVYREWTSETLNVQAFVEGVPGNGLAAARAAGYDLPLLAKRGADAVLRMILMHGFFHADLHAGNLFYLPGNRIAIVDFGMVGRLSEERRHQLVDLLAALTNRRDDVLLDVLLEWAEAAAVDEAKLASDMNELVFNYENVPLKEVRINAVLGELTAIMREHSLSLPPDLALLFKALITLEGLGRQIDPEFDMVAHIEPFVRRVIAQRYAPEALWSRGKRNLRDVLSLFSSVPRDLSRLLKEARRGRVRIDLDLKRLDHFGAQLDRSANRLTLGIITASLVIGSSIVMTVSGGPTLFGLSLFGLLGFIIAFANSLWIIFSIWRAKKD